MKLKLFAIFAAAALLLGMTGCSKEDNLNPMPEPSPAVWEKGVLPGRFTVNADGLQVQFAQGNLQYQASSHTWRLAEHQYDIVGDAWWSFLYAQHHERSRMERHVLFQRKR